MQVPVVFITDEGYATPTGVAIQSLVEHYEGSEKLNIIVIGSEISEDSTQRFMSFKSDSVEISVIQANSYYLTQYSENGYYVTPTALFKFCIAKLLPQYDKVLYVDGDVIFQQDISQLLACDIKGYYIAAVADYSAMQERVFQWHKRLNRLRYFNSGVMLINSEKWREDDVEPKLFAVKKAHPEYMCMDQDVLNDVFSDRVKYLPPVWNLQYPNLKLYTIGHINAFYHVNYENMEEAKNASTIVHLTNERKPWKYKNVDMSEEWLDAYSRSPFCDIPLNLKGVDDNINTGIIARRRWIRKEWTLPVTTLRVFGLPVVRKERGNNVTTICLFGVPLARRIRTEFEIITSVLGFRIRRKPNIESIDGRIGQCINALHGVVGSFGNAQNDKQDIWERFFSQEAMPQTKQRDCLKILYDFRAAQIFYQRGVGRYVCDMFESAIKQEGALAYILLDQNLPFPEIAENIEDKAIYCFLNDFENGFYADNFFDAFIGGSCYLPNLTESTALNTLYPVAVMRCCRAKTAILHDFIPLYYRNYIASADAMLSFVIQMEAMKHLNHIFVNSLFTQYASVRYLELKKEKFTCLYGGADTVKFTSANSDTPYDVSARENHIIYISGIAVQKNNEGFVMAFCKAFREKMIPVDARLYITCKANSAFIEMLREITENEQCVFGKQVIVTDFIPDEELLELLSSARASVFPSFMEGLGLPILESYMAGTPCWASNSSATNEFVIPECSFDPSDEQQMVDAIAEIYNNTRLCERSITFGRELIKTVNWDTGARKMLEALRTL